MVFYHIIQFIIRNTKQENAGVSTLATNKLDDYDSLIIKMKNLYHIITNVVGRIDVRDSIWCE